MILAWILFVLGFLAVFVTPVYYLSVSKPWRNPIGRLMLVQMATFILLYTRSLVALLEGHAVLSTNGVGFTIFIDIFLWSWIPVYEYVRRKAKKQK